MMNAPDYIDLDALLAELEALQLHRDADALPQLAAQFIRANVIELLALLRELRERRGRDDVSGHGGVEQRVIVEGFSDVSAAAALSDALGKASRYFSEQHDVSMTLHELRALPKGGHRAQVEVHITPVVLKDRAHSAGLESENKERARDLARLDKAREEHMKHLVFDHFAAINGEVPAGVPDFFLVNLNDAHLMNYMIEKQFFGASHPLVSAFPEPVGATPKILIRTRPELKEEA